MKSHHRTEALIAGINAEDFASALEPVLADLIAALVKDTVETAEISGGLHDGVLTVWMHALDADPVKKKLEDVLYLEMFAAQDKEEASKIASALRALADKFDAV